MPIVMFLTTSDLMRLDQDSDFSWARCRAPYHGFNYPVPHSSTLLPSHPAGTPALVSGGLQAEEKMNTLAHTEVRRNRLKNNTTRLSPAPDQAICNCWYKRKWAGYPTECVNGTRAAEIRGSAELLFREFRVFPEQKAI